MGINGIAPPGKNDANIKEENNKNILAKNLFGT
jgi:hypothetical protein